MYLCSVISKQDIHFKIKIMNEELEELINRKKQEIADYLRLSETLKLNGTTIEKRLDMMLDDLNRLMKKRK